MNNNSASNIKNKQNEYNSLGYQPKIFNVNSNKTIKIRRLMNPYLLRTMPHPSHSLYKSDEKRIYTSDFKTRKDKSQSSLSFADNHLLRLTQNLIYKHTDQNSQKKHRFTVQLMKNLDVLKEKKAIKSRKREILSLTGSMKSTKLRNLMQNELTNNQDFYSLGFLNYKNYKYIKPDKLCMDIFGTELELPKLGKEKEFKFIETFYETIKNKPLKQVHPQKHVFNNDNELNQTQNNRSIRIQNTIRSKTSVNNRKKNDFILKDLQESENRENTQEKEIKNILPYTIDKNDKLEIFMKTYFPKDPHMINEYFKLCNISKKLYFHCKNNENQNFKDKETFLNGIIIFYYY